MPVIGSVAAPIIAALLGAGLTYGLQRYAQKQETERKRDILRKSLFHELAVMEVPIRTAASMDGTRIRPGPLGSYTVFENYSDQLGLLSEEESEHLVSLYSNLSIYEDQTEMTFDILDKSDIPAELQNFNSTHELASRLLEQWELAIVSLMENIDAISQEQIDEVKAEASFDLENP